MSAVADLERRLELARAFQRGQLTERLRQHQVAHAMRVDELKVRPGALAIKDASGPAGDLIRGLACPLAGPLNGRDLQQERFTSQTDYGRSSFAGLPLLWAHGKDADVGDEPIGQVLSSTSGPEGVWITAQLRRSFQYVAAVRRLLADSKIFLSTGASPFKVAADGSIKIWKIKEVSLVINPANPYARAELAEKSMRWMY